MNIAGISKPICLLLLIFLWPPGPDGFMDAQTTAHEKPAAEESGISSRHLYHDIDWPEHLVDYDIFEKALHGHNQLLNDGQSLKKHLLIIIDFNRPSNEKRLWVIDLKSKEVPYHTWVAHGKNTGELWATEFSNQINSYKSSLGFYKTGKTYYGKHGLSLRLQGLEEGFNHQAGTRAIVIHGADYVSKDFIQRIGRLGRSHGCPAIPLKTAPDLIKLIAGGSYLFIYKSDRAYLKKSKILNAGFSGTDQPKTNHG